MMQAEAISLDETFETWLRAAAGEERERREHQRFPFFRYVTIIDGDQTIEQACCRDISNTSLGLAHFEPRYESALSNPLRFDPAPRDLTQLTA